MLSSRALLLVGVASSILVGPAAAFAAQVADQSTAASSTATPAQDGTQLQTVVVTARKRVENVLNVPISITALTASDLATRDIKSLSDVAAYTPGLSDDESNPGGARADRSFQQLVIRGMYPSNVSNPTTSVFINGVPVSADFVQEMDDLDRVEVLKGPQSAYFGRDTFAGAVNLTPVAAGNKLTGDFSAEVGTRETYNVTGAVTIPIIADKLSVRVGGSYDSHDGSYKNPDNPSQTLGDESSKSFHVGITAHPIDNLTIKAYGMILEDNDGPAATGLLLSTGAYAQGNCTVAGTPFFCGTLPGVNSAISPAQNTTVTSAISSFFSHPGGIINSSDVVKHFGLKRDADHGDLNIEYKIPDLGVTLTYLGGFNRDDWSELSDLSNVDSATGGQFPGYTGFPYVVESAEHDYSHEFRAATDQSKPIRGLIGFSYVDNRSSSGSGIPSAAGISANDATTTRTRGVFFSINYDVTGKLTLTYEGRYQSETEGLYLPTGGLVAKETFNDYLSRASIQYKILPQVMTYFTYSEGVNPGEFNSDFSVLPAASQAEIVKAGLAGEVVSPEHLKNYELGLKGRFWGGRAQLTADIYYDLWTDQINAGIYDFAATDPANPYNLGVVGSGLYGYNYANNTASTIAKGLELDGELIPVKYLTLNAGFALSDAQYSSYLCSSGTCTQYPDGYQAAGKYLAYSPRYSANFGAQYTRPTELLGAKDWYARGDYIFRSGVYIDAANTAETPNYNMVNIRGGMHWASFSVEGYVNNLTNTKTITSAFPESNFGGGYTATGVNAALPQLITGGVRLQYHY
ncbi:MAG: TonB-dependent receptor [Caulobacteraceae bacterium]